MISFVELSAVGLAGSGERNIRLCLHYIFFFQAEDGIRDVAVTGVQTCALPICRSNRCSAAHDPSATLVSLRQTDSPNHPARSDGKGRATSDSCSSRRSTRAVLPSGDRKSVV